MSVVRQLAQAILGLGLLSWVGWLLLTAFRDDHRPGADQPPDDHEKREAHLMWKILGPLAVMGFILALYLGDSILAFAAEQLRERRAYRLELERERTRQALIGHDRDALIWHQLDGAATAATKPRETG
jgi:hypothetical protein